MNQPLAFQIDAKMPLPDALSVGASLKNDYQTTLAQVAVQPPEVRRFLVEQSQLLSEALLDNRKIVRFLLPDRIQCSLDGETEPQRLPDRFRYQKAGGVRQAIWKADLTSALLQRFNELERSATKGVAVAARLLRFVLAGFIVSDCLPAGTPRRYRADEEILLPQANREMPEDVLDDPGSLMDQAPRVSKAEHFYLPEWACFDEQGGLGAASSSKDALHSIEQLQKFMGILHIALAFEPGMINAHSFQEKYHGTRDQLIFQGRALARLQTLEIIAKIRQRARENSLNRGLSLSLPFFDDQLLLMRNREFEVIPPGRIAFEETFVVEAAREEKHLVEVDESLSPSSREHLIAELDLLEQSFAIQGRFTPVGMMFERFAVAEIQWQGRQSET